MIDLIVHLSIENFFVTSLGIKPKKVTDLFRERAAKKRLEHLELQRTILQARNNAKTDNGEL